MHEQVCARSAMGKEQSLARSELQRDKEGEEEPSKIVSAKGVAKGQRGRGEQRTELKGNAPIKTIALGFVVSESRQGGRGEM